MVVLEYGGQRISWLANPGGGKFGPRQVLPAALSDTYAAHAGDIDGDGDLDVVIASYGPDLAWLETRGGGEFGPAQVLSKVAGNTTMVKVADDDGEVALTSYSRGEVVFENRLSGFANAVVPPTDGLYVAGGNLDFAVHFGVAVTVAGTPELALRVGDRNVGARYVGWSGSPTLTFRYVVTADDRADAGVGFPSAAVGLAGGGIVDAAGRPVPLGLPGVSLAGVRVNGSAPVVRSVSRLDATPTNVGSARFRVVFSEPVRGVTPADFAATAVGLSGVAVTAVSGSRAEYEVTVTTGTGSGTVGLGVDHLARITDVAGNRLGGGFADGAVYTLNRRPARTIDRFYERGHGDLDIGYADGV